jgi:5-methylcytosine-specific restriction endonuclease McrA
MWNKKIISKYKDEEKVFKYIYDVFTIYKEINLKNITSKRTKKWKNKILTKLINSYDLWIDLTSSDYINSNLQINDFTNDYKDILLTPKTRIVSSVEKNIKDLLKFAAFNLLVKEKIYVCPACNASHLFFWVWKNNISRSSEKDHFYPKNTVPIYSLNPKNIVPICKDCNNLKSSVVNKSFIKNFKYKYPYDFFNIISFSFFDFSSDITINDNNTWFIDEFHLKDRYEKNHFSLHSLQNEYNDWLNRKFITQKIYKSKNLNIEIEIKLNYYKTNSTTQVLSKLKYDFYKYIEKIENI